MKGSDALAAKVCTDAAMEFLAASATAIASITASVGGNLAALPVALQSTKAAVQGAMEEINARTKKYPWAAYIMLQADQGRLLASVADIGAWYRVTHEGCGGGRNTIGKKAKAMGEAVGFMLSLPDFRQRGNLSDDTLKQFHSLLIDQDMDGLKPVFKSILAGFRQGMAVEIPDAGPVVDGDTSQRQASTIKGRILLPDMKRNRKVSRQEAAQSAAIISAVVGVLSILT